MVITLVVYNYCQGFVLYLFVYSTQVKVFGTKRFISIRYICSKYVSKKGIFTMNY